MNILCRIGFHKWVGIECLTADAICGRFMARQKCYYCGIWHPDHDVDWLEADRRVDNVILF